MPRLKIKARNKSTALIHQGILASIEEQRGEVSPTAYYVAVMALLANPDRSILPQLLQLLEQALVRMNPVTVKHIEAKDNRTSSMLCSILKRYSEDVRSAQKAMHALRKLYSIVDLSEQALQGLHNFEPSKFNVDLMPTYNFLMEVVYLKLLKSNIKLCVQFLPFAVENWVKQFLNDTPEPVSRSACRALKKVLGLCICKEIIDQHLQAPSSSKSTSLSKILQILGTCLSSPHYKNSWDLVAELVGITFRRLHRNVLHESCFPKCRALVLQLESIHKLNDFHYTSAVEKALGRALRAMGAQKFIEIIDFQPVKCDESKSYLYAIFRKHVSHDSLKFWNDYFLPMTMQLKVMAAEQIKHANTNGAKLFEIEWERLWSIVPGFCKYAHDVGEGNNFLKLAKFVTELWPECSMNVRSVTCQALRVIALQYKRLADLKEASDMDEDGEGGEDDDFDDGVTVDDAKSVTTVGSRYTWKTGMTGVTNAEQGATDLIEAEEAEMEAANPHEFHGIPKEVAVKTVNDVLRKHSSKILPRLCNMFQSIDAGSREFVLETIDAYAKVADTDTLKTCFKTMLDKIKQHVVEHASEDDKAQVQATKHIMMDLACGMTDVLEPAHVGELYNVMLPFLQEKADVKLQKKAFKLLRVLCCTQKDFIMEHLSSLFHVFYNTQLDCAAGARMHRLRCLLHLFNMLYDNAASRYEEAVNKFLPEIIMSIKEAGSQTRDAAFYLLYVISLRVKELNDGKPDKHIKTVMQLMKEVPSPKLISSCIIVLAKLLYEFYDTMEHDTLIKMHTTVLPLLKEDSSEVRNAVLGFAKIALKVVVMYNPAMEIFKPCVPTVIEGCVYWLSHPKASGARLKIRVVVERLIKRYGYEFILGLTPEHKKRFVIYVNKQRLLNIRQKLREKEKSSMTTADWTAKFKREFFENNEEEEEDGKKRKKEKKKMSRPEESGMVMKSGHEEPEDMLDPSIVNSFYFRPRDHKASVLSADDDDFEMTIDPNGMIVVAEKIPQGVEDIMGHKATDTAQSYKKRKREGESDDEEEPQPLVKQSEQIGGRGGGVINKIDQKSYGVTGPIGQKLRDLRKKRRMLTDNIVTGEQFKAKNASGDLKKSAGPDPYAYIPLSARYANKRNKKAARDRFSSVVPAKDDSKVHQKLPRSKLSAIKKKSSTKKRSA